MDYTTKTMSWKKIAIIYAIWTFLIVLANRILSSVTDAKYSTFNKDDFYGPLIILFLVACASGGALSLYLQAKMKEKIPFETRVIPIVAFFSILFYSIMFRR